jgi:hypothetical protein
MRDGVEARRCLAEVETNETIETVETVETVETNETIETMRRMRRNYAWLLRADWTVLRRMLRM